MNIPIETSLIPFEKHGVQFVYPEVWELEEEELAEDNVVILTVSGDGTCFWSLHILYDTPPPPQVVDTCIEAFREEYDDADATPVEQHFAGMPAYARDVEFSCYELMNTASLQSVRTSDFTLLGLWQGADHELEEYRTILEVMTNSVQVDSLQD